MVRFCVLGTLERSFQASTRSTLYATHKVALKSTPVDCAHKAHPKYRVAVCNAKHTMQVQNMLLLGIRTYTCLCKALSRSCVHMQKEIKG